MHVLSKKDDEINWWVFFNAYEPLEMTYISIDGGLKATKGSMNEKIKGNKNMYTTAVLLFAVNNP